MDPTEEASEVDIRASTSVRGVKPGPPRDSVSEPEVRHFYGIDDLGLWDQRC